MPWTAIAAGSDERPTARWSRAKPKVEPTRCRAGGKASYNKGVTDELSCRLFVRMSAASRLRRSATMIPASVQFPRRSRARDHALPCRNSGLNAEGGSELPGAAELERPSRATRAQEPEVRLHDAIRQELHLPVVIPPESMANILANVMGGLKMRNLRVAETEKYAHVTYFFNGGVEKPFPERSV